MGRAQARAMMGAPKCCSHTSRGVCVPGAIDSVLGEISLAVALTKSYQKEVIRAGGEFLRFIRSLRLCLLHIFLVRLHSKNKHAHCKWYTAGTLGMGTLGPRNTAEY